MPNYNVGNVEVGIATQAEASIKMLDRAAAKCTRVAKSLDIINKRIDKTSTASNNAAKSTEKLNKKFSQTLSLNRIYFLYNYTKRLASGIADIIQTSIDYQETLNKFQNSMGNMYGDAVKFQNKITEAYSLSSKSLLDYQANFNNMLKGLGQIDETVSYSLSEKLTEMGVDIASLYNTSIESAMTKLQAALAQQTRPIRSVAGFDITQNTLSNVMSQIGINDRQISQLSQIEKRLLIVIALQRQMANTNTFGDWARTMNQPANQLRILKEQLIELKTVLGSFFIGTLRNILPYVNGIVMAIKEVLKTLASLMGIDINLPDSMSFDIEFGEEAEDAAAGLDKATKSAEKLKKATTGIDELNIISQNSDTSGAGASGIGGIGAGIDNRLLTALDSYNSQLDKTDNKAQNIRDKIMTWLGFTKEVDAETGAVTWKLDDGITRFDIIKGLLEGILITIGLIKVADAITKITGLLGIKADPTTLCGALFAVSFAILGVHHLFEGFSQLLDGDASNDVEGFINLLTGVGGLVAALLIVQGLISGEGGLTMLFSLAGAKFLLFAAAVAVVAGGIILLKNNWDKLSGMQKTIAIIGMAVVALTALAIAVGAVQSALTMGIAAVAIAAGTAAIVLSVNKGIKDAKKSASSDISSISVSGYATGGFPTRGDYFLANENGKPEYVGSIGNRTAVANQNQIVQGISYGVAMANSEQNALLRTQNDLLMRILSKGTDVYLNGRKVTDELSQVANARGTNPLSGGFSYV